MDVLMMVMRGREVFICRVTHIHKLNNDVKLG